MGLGILGDGIAIPLNPDDRQDDDCRGLVRRVHATKPHDTSLIWEFDNVAHQPLASDCRSRTSSPDPYMSASCQLSDMQG
jgi:hypothetical protein